MTTSVWDAIPRIFRAEAYVDEVDTAGFEGMAFVLVDERWRTAYGFNHAHRKVGHVLTGKWLSSTDAAGGRAERCLVAGHDVGKPVI